jgi:hypothetical protein
LIGDGDAEGHGKFIPCHRDGRGLGLEVGEGILERFLHLARAWLNGDTERVLGLVVGVTPP